MTPDIQKAVALLAKYLETQHPDFRTLSWQQARDVLSLKSQDVFCAWSLLVGREL